MGILAVLLAAAAAYGFGAIWYMALSKQWMAAAGLTEGGIKGNGGKQSPKPYIISAICMVLVAGMMRHIFAASGIETASLGLMAGFVGATMSGSASEAAWIRARDWTPWGCARTTPGASPPKDRRRVR